MDTHLIQTNKEIAQRFLQLAYSMNMQEAFSMLDDNITWWVIGDPSRVKVAGLKNREKTKHMMFNMHKALPDGMQYKVQGITAEGERVAIEVEAHGKWYNGKPYHNYYHFLFVIERGKIIAIKEYMDTMQIL